MLKAHARTYDLWSYFSDLRGVVTTWPALRQTVRRGRVSPGFAEQIKLIVSSVNGCRACSYEHCRRALRSGVSDAELASLMALDLGHFPPEQAVALAFAQHYAESGGRPDPQAAQRFRAYYGPQRSADIMNYLRLVQWGSMGGHTLDAFQRRLRGAPVPGSSLLTELVVVVLQGPLTLPRLMWMDRVSAYGRVRKAMRHAQHSSIRRS
jgi:AhpD family alkylhydroperoxidase